MVTMSFTGFVRKKAAFAVLVSVLSIVKCHAQEFTFTKAGPLDQGINSATEDIMPLVSQDGSTLYFTRALSPNNIGGELAGSDIWMSSKDEQGVWSAPSNDLPVWNNKKNNAMVGLNANGKVVYLLNSYNSKRGISFSKKLGDTWTKPEPINIKGLGKTGYFGCYVSKDYDVILISMQREDSEGDQDLYVSLKGAAGNWSAPVNLGTTINTEGFEISPYLTDDKKFLFFASNGHPGLGDSDIFVSERLYDSWDVWTKPKNLGENINSEGFDAYFSMIDSNMALFSSNRASGAGLSDIFKARILRPGEHAVRPDSVANLLAEARKLLKSNKEQELKRILVSFDVNSSTVSYADELVIKNYVQQLDETDYSKFKVTYVTGTSNDSKSGTLFKNRMKKLVTILKSNGIPDFRIQTEISDNKRGDLGENDFELIVVQEGGN